MGTGGGESETKVAATLPKDVKEEAEKVEQEMAPDTADKGDDNKQEDAKMPPPATAASPGGAGAGAAGDAGTAGAAGGKISGSDAIQAAVKAGNINIHQEERESLCAPSLPACS